MTALSPLRQFVIVVVSTPSSAANSRIDLRMASWSAAASKPVHCRARTIAFAVHHERDAAELMACIRALDQLVADVQAGRVRLPEQAGAFPPKTVQRSAGGRS
ncbi:hypothetical protein IFM12275_40700 [Nocardia sputorum]|nr:hypothetical protein IFM12275_40700 [Nocardia sputorum]